MLFARGRGIEGGGAAGQVAVEDVTPTVLAWLGLPVGEDMDGRVAGFLAAPDLAQIPTHDTMPVERLRDLGYLDTGAGAELE